MLLLNDNDSHPDESELHRFGADPGISSWDHAPDLPRLIVTLNTKQCNFLAAESALQSTPR